MRLIGDGFDVDLEPGKFLTFGRDAETCQIPLISEKHPLLISRMHLELRVDAEGRVILRDLRSQNGVFLGGRRLGLDEVVWESGDLEIGTSGEFKFRLGGDDLEMELRKSVEEAKKRSRKFLNLAKPCKPEDMQSFFAALKSLPRGSGARRFYLSLVGLTPDFCLQADPVSLYTVKGNLKLPADSNLLDFIGCMNIF